MACITGSYKWTRAVKKYGRHPTWVVMKRRGFQTRTAWQAVNLLSLNEICHKFTVLTHKMNTKCHHRLRKHAVTEYWLLCQKCYKPCVLFLNFRSGSELVLAVMLWFTVLKYPWLLWNKSQTNPACCSQVSRQINWIRWDCTRFHLT